MLPCCQSEGDPRAALPPQHRRDGDRQQWKHSGEACLRSHQKHFGRFQVIIVAMLILCGGANNHLDSNVVDDVDIQEPEEEGGGVPEADWGAARHLEVGSHSPSTPIDHRSSAVNQ